MRNEFEKLKKIAEILKDEDTHWCDKRGMYVNQRVFQDSITGYLNGAWYAYQEQRKNIEATTQSRQTEVDELNRKIAMYEKYVNAIKYIHENQFDENSDTSWILGNLDGFFECLESDLKGKENEY